jgi:hypothetical protein
LIRKRGQSGTDGGQVEPPTHLFHTFYLSHGQHYVAVERHFRGLGAVCDRRRRFQVAVTECEVGFPLPNITDQTR